MLKNGQKFSALPVKCNLNCFIQPIQFIANCSYCFALFLGYDKLFTEPIHDVDDAHKNDHDGIDALNNSIIKVRSDQT